MSMPTPSPLLSVDVLNRPRTDTANDADKADDDHQDCRDHREIGDQVGWRAVIHHQIGADGRGMSASAHGVLNCGCRDPRKETAQGKTANASRQFVHRTFAASAAPRLRIFRTVVVCQTAPVRVGRLNLFSSIAIRA